MPETFMRRNLNGFEPADGEGPPRVPVGDVVKVTYSRPRSLAHQRLYWGLIRLVFENQSYFTTKDHLHQAVKLATGYAHKKTRKNGEQYTVYDSTSFEAMDQTEFNEYFERVVEFVCSEVIPNLDEGDLKREIEGMIKP